MNSIVNNLLALNANRIIGINNKNRSNSTQKLSTGYRINRAGDDSAGLAISEKMRSQIRGLDRASDNIQDGISLLQTADGALSEVHAMLQRMTELTVQASNDTNTQEDRAAIAEEISQLREEINRIGTDTEFNTMKLFDGNKHVSTIGGDAGGGSNTINRNYQLAGTPTDTSVTDYVVSADAISGISIGDENYPWTSISNGMGQTLGDGSITAGTYSVVHDGVTLSFDVLNTDTLDTVSNALDGLKFHVEVTPGKTYSVNSLNFKLYTPEESGSITKEEFLDYISDSPHEIIVDDIGIGIDIFGSSQTWDELFAQTGMSQEDALANGGSFLVGEAGKYELEIQFAPGSTIEGLKEELDGVLFDVEGKVSDTSIAEAVSPIASTGIQATVLSVSLSKEFADALGYTSLYGDNNMWAVYNDSMKTHTDPYIFALEFAPNTDKVSTVPIPLVYLDENSQNALASIFSGGTTSSSGSIVLNFESKWLSLDKYGYSTASIRWDYPAGISYSDLYSDSYNGSYAEHTPLFGTKALEVNVYTSYDVTNLSTNTIDTSDKVAYSIDDSEVDTSEGNSDSEEESVVKRIIIQAGANQGQSILLDIDKMNGEILGMDKVDVSDHMKATKSIDIVHEAVNIISSQRSKIGAYQNRLEHAMSNVDNTSENLQDAESRIRDTDMAGEMMKFAKYQILEQASQSIMAQALKSGEAVMQLLK